MRIDVAVSSGKARVREEPAARRRRGAMRADRPGAPRGDPGPGSEACDSSVEPLFLRVMCPGRINGRKIFDSCQLRRIKACKCTAN